MSRASKIWIISSIISIVLISVFFGVLFAPHYEYYVLSDYRIVVEDNEPYFVVCAYQDYGDKPVHKKKIKNLSDFEKVLLFSEKNNINENLLMVKLNRRLIDKMQFKDVELEFWVVLDDKE